MQRSNPIETSDSPYSAQMVVVLKPDGALRVCIEFRRINLNIINDAYTMQRIKDQLDAMGGAKVFTTLYLTKGYHQLLLHPDLKPVTALLTPDGLFQRKALPLGMKTTGAVLQRVMDQILQGLQLRCVAVYIDDITVHSPTIKQHQRDLEEFFRRLEAASLSVSVSKTRLAQDSVLVLGHRVSAKGIEPNPGKVSAIL